MDEESDWFWEDAGVRGGESESNGEEEGSAAEESLMGRAEGDGEELGQSAVEF